MPADDWSHRLWRKSVDFAVPLEGLLSPKSPREADIRCGGIQMPLAAAEMLSPAHGGFPLSLWSPEW
jgi:hypothetical protein